MSFTSDIKNEIEKLKQDKNDKKDFLRKVFLANGTITDPNKEYHLEITSDSIEYANLIKNTMLDFGINAKVFEKKYNYSTYIKDAESIALFLNIIGAHKSLLDFENVKVTHEMNNQINRMVNCETANLSKIVNTAVRQVEAIKKIELIMGLDKLPEGLKEIAKLRLENPDISLLELGKLLTPPLGKSGVNHRLKKLEEIAKEIGMDKN